MSRLLPALLLVAAVAAAALAVMQLALPVEDCSAEPTQSTVCYDLGPARTAWWVALGAAGVIGVGALVWLATRGRA